MGWRTGLKYDDDFKTGWIIAGVFAVLLLVLFGFVVWATGSWIAAVVITVVALVGLLITT